MVLLKLIGNQFELDGNYHSHSKKKKENNALYSLQKHVYFVQPPGQILSGAKTRVQKQVFTPMLLVQHAARVPLAGGIEEGQKLPVSCMKALAETKLV